MSHAEHTYHSGELAVQERMGVTDMAARIGRGIGTRIPSFAVKFVREVETVAVGGLVQNRATIWLLSGPPGFVKAPTSDTVMVRVGPSWPDWIQPQVETALGLLAIDFASRHRMRFNGRVIQPPSRREDGAGVAGTQLTLRVQEVYGNCPKYIQKRVLVPDPVPALPPGETGPGNSLAGLFPRVDTILLATASPEGGADVSHRGGRPGFVDFDGTAVLSWDEYPGNTMYNTLGNLEHDPRAALLVLDFEGRRAVRLTGEARVAYARTGAMPRVHFTVQDVVWGSQPLPWRVESREPSPFNL